jgi:hypothetical protein
LNAYLNIRVALIAIAVLLGLFGVSNAFLAVFYRASFEVTWNYEVTARYCSQGQCAYSGLLSLANTGRKTQPEVTVTVQGIPIELGGQPRVINLDSSEPRSADPDITQGTEDGVHTIELGNFTSGALAEFRFQGVIAEQHLNSATPVEVRITSRGRLIEGNPRAIAFGRWFG